MYQDALSNQWRNLYSDFSAEYETLSKQPNSVSAFNRWYEARVHRWSSIAYQEGVILDEEKNPEFAEELRRQMQAFKFRAVASGKVPRSTGQDALISGGCGGLIGVGMLALQFGMIKSIITGGISIAALMVALSRNRANSQHQEEQRVKDNYTQQLKDYLPSLIGVCEKYGM